MYDDKIKDERILKVCSLIGKRTIEFFKDMTECMMSGDDSILTNVWEEICYQLHFEESFSWDAYEMTVYRVVEEEVKLLHHEDKQSIWFCTPEGSSWYIDHLADGHEHEEYDCIPWDEEEVILYIIRNFVYSESEKYIKEEWYMI